MKTQNFTRHLIFQILLSFLFILVFSSKLGMIINQQKFVELLQLKYLKALKIEYWQDFKRFYRTEFEKIKQCKDKINTYREKRKDRKQKIM